MHRTFEELVSSLEAVRRSPADNGLLEAIVVRPDTDQRRSLKSCRLDESTGAEGDKWVKRFPSPPVPGTPDQESQITLMNSRMVDFLAGDRERWALAGDQLYVDLDLSDDNLHAGDQLAIGSSVVEITPMAHNGCRKFAARFGESAFKFVNSPEGKRFHLRGIYARVIQSGDVHVGDRIVKLGPSTGTRNSAEHRL